MKKPDKVKKGLETCIGECTGNKPHCPYHTCGNGCMDTMNKDARAYIQQLEAQVPKWISVEERLPELFTNVLVIVKCKSNSEIRDIKISSRYTPIGWYHTEWRWGCTYNEEVTHWMPLPVLPKEDDRAQK